MLPLGTRQLTSLIHCSPFNASFKKFLGALYHSRETLPLSERECTWPIWILGLLSLLPLINPTNWVSCMLVVTGGCTQTVLLCMVSLMAGLEMILGIFSGYMYSTFFPLFFRSSVVCFLCLVPRMHKTKASEALRASKLSLWKSKTHCIALHCFWRIMCLSAYFF